MKLKTLGTIAIGLVWTGLAAWAARSVYYGIPPDQPWVAAGLESIIAIAYTTVLLKLKTVPRAISAILWMVVLLFGVTSLVASLVPEAGLPGWSDVVYLGGVTVLWLLVLIRWNSFIAVGNAFYTLVWYWAVFIGMIVTVALAVGLIPLLFGWFGTFDSEACAPVFLRVLIVAVWVTFILLRIPWRYPWLLLPVIAMPFGLPAFVVMLIGSAKLVIESRGRKNVLAGSRFKAGPISTPTRGLVEYHA